ncbi:uncharacterized protein MYCFIDRAFT_111310, partial [Pseudocercospora fijiensis CIRAD86]
VAVAGGTGGLGRAFADVLQNDYKVIVLTHQPKTREQEVSVDYNDIQQLRDVLETNDIFAVVSTLSDAAGDAQINLLEACLQSQSTRRFIPSSWFLHYPRRLVGNVYYFRCLDRLNTTLETKSLEWTVVSNGIFLDYFGMPRMPTTLRSACFIVDMQHEMIAIPGDGNDVVTLTSTRDVAAHVSALLKLPVGSWPRQYHIAGDRMTLNDFVKLTKMVTGRQLRVVYDEKEKLQRGEITLLPSQSSQRYGFDLEIFMKYIAIMETWIVDGLMDIEPTPVEGMPTISCTTVKEMLE